LFEDGVEYSDGTKASVDQMAKDVTQFLTWAADPKMEQRKQTGWAVMLYLLILALLLYGSYRAVWRNVKH
jgi:ubiquinol-cytochrome c reductase cytochrome c1 subunit